MTRINNSSNSYPVIGAAAATTTGAIAGYAAQKTLRNITDKQLKALAIPSIQELEKIMQLPKDEISSEIIDGVINEAKTSYKLRKVFDVVHSRAAKLKAIGAGALAGLAAFEIAHLLTSKKAD